MNQGVCRGGPLAGETMVSRFPKGFLLVDKQADQCWVYEWEGEEFWVRDGVPAPVLHEGRIKAALESNYDVIAAPWVVSDGN